MIEVPDRLVKRLWLPSYLTAVGLALAASAVLNALLVWAWGPDLLRGAVVGGVSMFVIGIWGRRGIERGLINRYIKLEQASRKEEQ